MSEIKNAQDLRVYKLALELLDQIYEVAYKIPHLKLRTQIIKSAEAIAPLISEGFSKRRSTKEAARFYEMAMTESDEIMVHLDEAIILSKRFSKIPTEDCKKLAAKYKELSKQLNRLNKIWREYSD